MMNIPDSTGERRALLVGGVYLSKGRLKLAGQAVLAARNGIELKMQEAKFLALCALIRDGSAGEPS